MSERTADQLQIDRQVIDGTLRQLQDYLADVADQEWSRAFYVNGAVIDELYDEFVPRASDSLRLTGKLLGASTLTFVERTYGPDAMHPRTYGGAEEQNVLATYHNGAHSRGVVRDMFRYARACNTWEGELPAGQAAHTFAESDFARFPVIGGGHDIIMGNGRGHDERQSAQFAAELVCLIGGTLMPDEPTAVAVGATAWDVNKNRHSVDPSKGSHHLQTGVCVADLLPLFDERGPVQALCLAPEDFSKKRYGQIFTREARAAGFPLAGTSVEKCMEFIGERETLQRAYGEFLDSEVGFFANYTPPDARLDRMFPGRQANVELLAKIRAGYHAGRISARQTLEIARAYQQTSQLPDF